MGLRVLVKGLYRWIGWVELRLGRGPKCWVAKDQDFERQMVWWTSVRDRCGV